MPTSSPHRLNLADPAVEPTQRDWQRLAARAMKGVNERHAAAMAGMLARIDAQVLEARERAARFQPERKAA